MLGLKPSRTYRFRLILIDAAGKTVRADQPLEHTTGPLPADFPPIRTLISKPGQMEPGVTVFNVVQWVNGAGNEKLGYIIAVDAKGEVVWYFRADHPISVVKRLRNGHLLYMRQHRVHPWSAIVEIDMLGNVIKSWYAAARIRRGKGPRNAVPLAVDTFHHDLLETPAGTFRTITTEVRRLRKYPVSETGPSLQMSPANVVGDVIVEFDRSGKILKKWKLLNLLDPQRIGYGSLSHFWDGRCYRGFAKSGGTRDWSHANSLFHDPKTKSMIVSVRHQDAVVKIDEKTNRIVWILANPHNWRGRWRRLLLKPIGPLKWPYHQHAPKITSAGTLLMYDNGNYQASPFQRKLAARENSTRVVEFAIDEKNLTVRQVWEYRGEPGERYYCPLFGEADLLEKTGNILISDGGMIFDAQNQSTDQVPGDRQWARIIELSRDGPTRKVFEIRIGDENDRRVGWSLYRGKRYPGSFLQP
ncbi:MAG: aryl-sulfate sulfotransferase [Planctomycetes bacterium]|nr:aryl-sulfate sulfotransferase [Planctomycetota bacterium]